MGPESLKREEDRIHTPTLELGEIFILVLIKFIWSYLIKYNRIEFEEGYING